MRFLKACVHESQRMKPAVAGLNRETTQDMVLGSYQIPAGTVVTYWNMLAMNNEKNFPEPERFKPERWLRGCPGQHTAHPFAAIPFSFGPRMCIGRRFAELEVYMLAIKVLVVLIMMMMEVYMLTIKVILKIMMNECTYWPSRWCRSSDWSTIMSLLAWPSHLSAGPTETSK